MQIPQGVSRDSRHLDGHTSANRGVEHPVWYDHNDARLDLDVHDAPIGALLAVLRSNMSPKIWMPAIVNFNFLPDMGRMTA